MDEAVSIPLKTLKWWRELVDLNPADLAPRMDQYLAAAPEAKLVTGDDAIRLGIAAAAEPVAWTGSSSMASIAKGHDGFIFPVSAPAHPIPLYAAPRSDGLRDVKSIQPIDPAAMVELGPDGKEWAKTQAACRHVAVLVERTEKEPRLAAQGAIDKYGPWHGWAVREAFVAGAEWQEGRDALTGENEALKAEVLKLKGGGLDLLNEILRFETAAKNLLDSLSFDDNGAMVGGKWMGGEGGLLSEKTRKLADALRRLLGGAE